ncbi:hypothetical protein GCM10023192_07470 [Amycolatopsis samaneae]
MFSVSSTGGSSMITCAFVPLMPNAEIPARRGPSPRSQATGSVSSRTVPADQSTFGVGVSTCSVFGSSEYRIAMIILITLATPPAAWVCPRFDFTEPSHSGRSPARPAP